ncbi:YeiH family protein [Furfurilactobacillus siliginis]|uniref:UPF0324 membrane protein YdhF n=1 Tax=Furfurilactobacillus siliginis TaxID=348151 RepID=A0A0R2L2I9_9LACO|nr:putative sulfate exporter family transporter [Furfurilactobacillus siliginis]KRN96040.1 hypothetical protein IV55_GL001721 [Furfurilactobacillus siliginis]GEK29270.1 UPF0324 membrane protein YdhF [Furfurilactobacillus siliginis]
MKPLRAVGPGLGLSIVIAIISQLIGQFVIKGLGAATIAILLGIILGNTVFQQPQLASGTAWAEKRLLELSVMFLGATVTFQTIGALRWQGFVFIVLQMAITIIGVVLIGKKMRFNEGMTLLMAGGNAVCGSSAIAAITPVIDADDKDKRTAVTLVNLMGTILMLGLPLLGTAVFGHSDFLRGALIGGTVQSVGQVVASGTMINAQTTTFATLFKIMRIILLVVVVLIFGRLHRQQQTSNDTNVALPKSSSFLPWYVLGFLVLCALNSLIHFLPIISGTAHFLSSWCEIIALAAIGLRLNLAAFIKAGKQLAIYGATILILQVGVAVGLIWILLK